MARSARPPPARWQSPIKSSRGALKKFGVAPRYDQSDSEVFYKNGGDRAARRSLESGRHSTAMSGRAIDMRNTETATSRTLERRESVLASRRRQSLRVMVIGTVPDTARYLGRVLFEAGTRRRIDFMKGVRLPTRIKKSQMESWEWQITVCTPSATTGISSAPERSRAITIPTLSSGQSSWLMDTT